MIDVSGHIFCFFVKVSLYLPPFRVMVVEPCGEGLHIGWGLTLRFLQY